jgi:hypothetical protein
VPQGRMFEGRSDWPVVIASGARFQICPGRETSVGCRREERLLVGDVAECGIRSPELDCTRSSGRKSVGEKGTVCSGSFRARGTRVRGQR